MTGRWSATAAKPSTRCACGPRPRRIISISRNSAAAISSARWPKRSRPNRSPACCIPTIRPAAGKGLRFVQEYFLVACSLADLVRRFRSDNSDWSQLPEKVAIQLNDTHPDHGRAGIDAHPAGRSETRLGRSVGHHQADAGLHEPHAAARSPGEMAGRLV